MGYYINFTFKDLTYDEDSFTGKFESRDLDVRCSFHYNRKTKQAEIWDNNKPIEEIVPLPMGWLEYMLKSEGKLDKDMYKISY